MHWHLVVSMNDGSFYAYKPAFDNLRKARKAANDYGRTHQDVVEVRVYRVDDDEGCEHCVHQA